jgi:hypothetical protein
MTRTGLLNKMKFKFIKTNFFSILFYLHVRLLVSSKYPILQEHLFELNNLWMAESHDKQSKEDPALQVRQV